MLVSAVLHDSLRSVPIFANLDGNILRLLYVRSATREFAPGEALMREGEEGTTLHVLLAGRVAVESQSVRIAERGPGDCFGEMSLIDGGPRSATVIALDPCRILVIDQAAFEGILLEQPQAAWAVMKTLVHRLREQAAELASLRK